MAFTLRPLYGSCWAKLYLISTHSNALFLVSYTYDIT